MILLLDACNRGSKGSFARSLRNMRRCVYDIVLRPRDVGMLNLGREQTGGSFQSALLPLKSRHSQPRWRSHVQSVLNISETGPRRLSPTRPEENNNQSGLLGKHGIECEFAIRSRQLPLPLRI